MRAVLAALAFALGCSGSVAGEAPPRSPPPPPPASSAPAAASSIAVPDGIEGMTVSCPTWGWEWGTDEMVDTMVELKGLGVEWIAIHPYARISNDGTVSFRPVDPAAPPEHIARPIREAHARGLKIMIKPHLAYWRSKWSWRGAIDLQGEELGRFWRSYGRWIDDMAVASAGADLFVVGTELDRLTHQEAEWRRVIASVRARYDGPLTFASNWDSYGSVPFWDALDAVGIQAYFPLVDGPDAPTDAAALAAGWGRVMTTLTDFSRRVDRPVVFTELGYNTSAKAAREPWAYDRGGPDAEGIQTRCMTAALAAIEETPAVRGAFLWKWFPGPTHAEDFLASTPAMRSVLGKAWGDAPNPPGSK